MAKNDKNVDVKVDIIEEVKTEAVVDVIEVSTKEKKVKVKLIQDVSVYIGDRWFYFDKGQETFVPEHIKDILMSRGVLGVL